MKIIGENIRETVSKEIGNTVYYTNADGDRVPVVFNAKDGSLQEVRTTTSKRLASQHANKATYNASTNNTPRLWIRAGQGMDIDSGEVLVWHDSTSDANHLTSVSPRPKEEGRGVRFDGSGEFFSLTTELTLTEFTVVLAVVPNGLNKQYFMGDANSVDSFLGIGHSAGYDYAFGFDTGVSYQSQGDVLNDRQLQVISYRRDLSDNLTVRHNAVEQYSAVGTGQILKINQIARRHTQSPSFWGEMYEVLIYHTALSDAELANVEDGVIKRNGVSV